MALWLRTRVRVEASRDPVMLVPRAYIALAAYVDGVQVLRTPDYRDAAGLPLYVVPLPRDADEATVTLRVVSRYTQVGLPDGARVGDRGELVESLVSRDAPRTGIGIVLVSVGLAALVLSLRGRERHALRGIALFSLAAGGWALFHTRARELWLPAHAMWFAIWWLSASVVALGAALFVDAIFPRRFVRWSVWFFAVHTAVSVLSLAPFAPFDLLAAPLWASIRIIGIGATIGALVMVSAKARRGEREARWFVLGFTCVTVGITHDVAVSLGWVSDGLLLTDVGYLVLEVTWIAIVWERVRAMEARALENAARLDRFVKERDELVRELHDGLGGVVTNVRLLAERAQSGEGEAAPALETIASLAGQGMSELRTLMVGFDELPESYRALGAELRRSGVTALEAHGIEHEFDAKLEPDGLPQPDLARFVALSRVHREAIVNVIKHADASKVRVSLEVTRASVSLTVEDDGRGVNDEAPRSPGTGRGLVSMRARARALNATLVVEPAAPRGTRVALKVPMAAGPTDTAG